MCSNAEHTTNTDNVWSCIRSRGGSTLTLMRILCERRLPCGAAVSLAPLCRTSKSGPAHRPLWLLHRNYTRPIHPMRSFFRHVRAARNRQMLSKVDLNVLFATLFEEFGDAMSDRQSKILTPSLVFVNRFTSIAFRIRSGCGVKPGRHEAPGARSSVA